jgi:chemotaxis protein MotB
LYKNLNKKEEKVNTDRYFITYADMITLLLGLFVILYASSKVDQEKYKEFSKAFKSYFNQGESVLNGGSGVLEGHKKTIPEPILDLSNKKSLEEIFSQTSAALKDYINKGTLQIKKTNSSITLILPEKLLFLSGKADIQVGAYPLIDTLAMILHGIPYQVTVDGHTDSQPIRTFQYESNWHLSVGRALNVGYGLIEKGVPQSNMVIRGYGAQRPIADNNTEAGKTLNRRVEITISSLPSDAPSTEEYEKISK